MSTQSVAMGDALSAFEQIRYARQIIELESHALGQLAARLDGQFARAVEMLYGCRGSVLVTGMGKAGLVGQKLSATLASTGTPSHFLHPAEAIHGDLGRIQSSDVLVALSQSGETEEVVRLLPSLLERDVPILAITSRRTNRLAQAARVSLELGSLDEACSLGLAPSTSTTAMLALGDALALVTSRMRGFRAEDFARFHPGGSLGRKLAKVEECMRPLAQCRVAQDKASVREVFSRCTRPGRRTGAIMLVSDTGRLTGIFTDSDLARLFEGQQDNAFDQPIRELMTTEPATIAPDALMRDAVQILAERKISELPVVSPDGEPLGLIDITDVASMLPENESAAQTAPPSPLRVARPEIIAYSKPGKGERRR